jgi:hypothetical protein
MALTKFNFNSFDLTTVASTGLAFNASANGFDTAAAGALNLLATNTITSGVLSSSFTSNIDSTYDTYMFKLINIHPASNDTDITFQGSTNGGSSYGVTLTSTNFQAYHFESGNTGLGYETSYDLAQSTSYQILNHSIGTDNDQSASGTLFLFSPSNTTFVKHFIYRGDCYHASDLNVDAYVVGYLNTTSAINAIDFKMSSGSIDSGVIKMYGITK